MEPPVKSPPQTPQSGGSNTNRKSTKSRNIKPPAASRGENSKVILKGWLYKQEGGGLKLWKKKWCVLADFGLFFYKDQSEQNYSGSILLPSYSINPCSPSDVNKKFSFKAEHENMKTFYFASENQVEMNRWLEALRMASLVQRAPGAGPLPKLIPKSPIMSWDDSAEGPSLSPPDMQQYPFSGANGDTSRVGSEFNDSFRDRSPLRPRENTQNMNPNGMVPRQSLDSSSRSQTSSYRDQESASGSQYDPRLDRSRESQRSSRSQQSFPDAQRSWPGQGQRPGSDYPPLNTLPRDMKIGHPSSRGQGQMPQGQGYNSLPRDIRNRVPSGQEGPSSHSSPRQTLERQMKGQGQGRRDDLNPYMSMSSPQKERKMDPSKNNNRPLPQEPVSEQRHERGRSGGGDYASLTRIRDKWPNQNLSYQEDGSMQQQVPIGPGGQVSSSQLRPDLYVDIPHTYVNVYDESQVRNQPPELPSRPPLPAEMRHQIVEDIAKTHSPNTQHNLLAAEQNLELRMRQPPYFQYPTPVRESLPPFPQDSPRSQYSQRSQRSNDPRSNDPRSKLEGHHLQPPRRPDLAPSAETPVVRQDARDSYMPPRNYDQSYNVQSMKRDLDGSDNTLTNEDKNNKISEFYGLGKYNEKNRYDPKSDQRSKFMSELDVHSRTLPSKPITGVTGEKDFRLRSLPDHVQSMPAIYHEQQPLSIEVPDREPVSNSYQPSPAGQSDSRLLPADQNDQSLRKSAFRPLSNGSNSLQRVPSLDNSMNSYTSQGQGYPGAYNKHPGYPDQEQTDMKRLSAASSQMSQSRLPRKPDSLSISHQGEGQARGQGYRGQRMAPPIQTVKEDPDMPDSDVIPTELPQKVFNLNGPRLRMSISAGDLLGKNHDELVLLLIQLRRDKAELNEQRDTIRRSIEQSRPAEFYYRKLQNEGRPIDQDKEMEHRKYMDIKRKLEDVEKRLEVYKPLVNLVCNMVTMGSLYGGDNFMLATEYRKHLLSPDQYSPPKKMLEFSRKHQEEQVVQEIEEDVKELTKEQADLEEKNLLEKQDRLYELDRILQQQSYQVTSLKEDRELLERALGGLLKKQDQYCTNPQELDKLIHQQRTIERELSRVLHQLAQASKELEETTAENNKIEHEVALLRSKVHGNVSRSKSAPSLSSESLRTKMKMEKDLAKVTNIMQGLSEQGAKLQEMMTSLRQSKPTGTNPQSPLSPSQQRPENKSKQNGTTYYETDLDNNQSKDLAQVTALLASYKLLPQNGETSPEAVMIRSSVSSLRSPPPSTEAGTSAFRTVSPREEETYHAAPVQAVLQQAAPQRGSEEPDGPSQWDIGEADDNTKRFFDPQPLRVGIIPSDYNDPTHVYENLPQQKSSANSEPAAPAKYPWSSVLPEDDKPSASQRRKSATRLMAPKPFSKSAQYNNVSNVSGPYSSVQNIDQSDPLLHNQDFLSQSQPVLYNSVSTPLETSQSNDSKLSADSPTLHPTIKTPPPPPVRGTSKLFTAEVSQNFLESLNNKPTNRNYAPPVPAILKKGKGRSPAQKARYMTISSSQPLKLETNVSQSPKLHSQAGDLISSMEVPDIVKSSTTRIENFDEKTIEREILFFPQKVDIPERYIPDSDDEEDNLTAEEKAQRQEKADKIKRILTQQSDCVHSLSQPDVSKVAGEVHQRVQQEKLMRAQLLGIGQELAEQVKRKSRQFAAERRKTWSGSSQKTDNVAETGDHSDGEVDHHGDANNNSYTADGEPVPNNKDSFLSAGGLYGDEKTSPNSRNTYGEDGEYLGGGNSYSSPSPYYDVNFTSTSFSTRPNFKI